MLQARGEAIRRMLADDPETHLIPNVLMSLPDVGRKLKIFGDDYETRDGSCVRDYVHVVDLCEAHLQAAAYMNDHSGAAVLNLGNGNGFSVFEIIDAAMRVTGETINYEIANRRPSDPPFLVADAGFARQSLGWTPRYTSIDAIIESAWTFHRRSCA